MIIFGSRRRKTVVGRMQYLCPRCHQQSFHTVERSQSHFTLFFVPVIPLPSNTISRCETCGYRAPVDNQTAIQPGAAGMQGQGMYGAPPMQGQGMYGAPPMQGQGMYGAPPMQGQGMYGAPPMQGQGMYGAGMPFPTQSPFIGVGPRFLATLLDGVILFIFLIIVSAIFSKAPAVAELLILCILFAYYVVMEAVWGATVGKMALKLHIVHIDGSPIGWSEALIRTLLRMVDGLFCYVLGAIVINNSARHQRVGDMVAKTVVVRRS